MVVEVELMRRLFFELPLFDADCDDYYNDG